MTFDGFVLISLLTGVSSATALGWKSRIDSVPAETRWLFLAVITSITAFIAANLVGPDARFQDVLFFVCSASCGFSWLYSRSLFSSPKEPLALWCWMVVGLIVVSHLVIDVLHAVAPASDIASDVSRVALNINVLASSTTLLLGPVEPLISKFAAQRPSERRFRLLFVVCYGMLMGISCLWLSGAGQVGSVSPESIRVCCALLALFGAVAAMAYRCAHPLTKTARQPTAKETYGVPAERILSLIKTEELYTQTELKVEDLAKRLDLPEYRLTRVITGEMGFRNFNQMINGFRLEHAKARLLDSAYAEHSILSIAMESGFNSVGPFNRAFKAECGCTPSQFRRQGVLST